MPIRDTHTQTHTHTLLRSWRPCCSVLLLLLKHWRLPLLLERLLWSPHLRTRPAHGCINTQAIQLSNTLSKLCAKHTWDHCQDILVHWVTIQRVFFGGCRSSLVLFLSRLFLSRLRYSFLITSLPAVHLSTVFYLKMYLRVKLLVGTCICKRRLFH